MNAHARHIGVHALNKGIHIENKAIHAQNEGLHNETTSIYIKTIAHIQNDCAWPPRAIEHELTLKSNCVFRNDSNIEQTKTNC